METFTAEPAVISVIAARYRAKVAAAVEFAQTDEFTSRYAALGWSLAANIALADRFGTWVAHDAMKELGLV